jgi:hypothetical protein
MDAEALLRAARRPLVIGMGGGGDVVGALATAEALRLYDGAEPVLGGLSWERRPVDPQPGARSVAEIAGAELLAPSVMLAGPQTRIAASGVRFAESGMAEFLGEPVVLVDINPGAAAVARDLRAAVERLGCDLTVLVDVGGDVLAQGDEPGLRSPLSDSIMLAAGGELARGGMPVLLGVFGIGCDAELTPGEVLGRLSLVAAAGGLAAVRGLTEPVAARVEAAMELVLTEASAQAVRAFRGASGDVPIRDGARVVRLSAMAAATFFLDVELTLQAAAPLARAVAAAGSLEEANTILRRRGVPTELELERQTAAAAPGAAIAGQPRSRRSAQ